jgi:hypothetical protein
MATKSSRSARRPTPSEATDIGAALDAAGNNLRDAVDALLLKVQQEDSEAQFECSREAQQAELDQRKGDADAQFAYMTALREAEGRDDYPSVALDLAHKFEQGVQERRLEAHKRVSEAGEAYRRSVEDSRQRYADELREIYRQHIAALKAVWASIEPEAVENDELARLGHLTMAAAQSLPAAERQATSDK